MRKELTQAPDGAQASNVTPGDVRAEIERFVQQLAKTRMPELLEHVARLERLAQEAGVGRRRVPVAFVGDLGLEGSEQIEQAALVSEQIEQQLVVPCRLEHLVVTPATARAFELVELSLGYESVHVSSTPLALEPFSLAHVQGDKLPDVMRWKTSVIPLGTRIRMIVRRTVASGERFCGLLWVSYD